MKKFAILKSLLLLIAITTTNAYAVIIEGNFKGTVRSFTNGDKELGFTGFWGDDIQGTEASGSFWYDTEIAPENTSDFTTSGFYQSYTDKWMGSSFNIDGQTFNISDFSPIKTPGILSEGIWLHNLDPLIDNSTREMYYLFDNITIDTPGNYKSIGLMVEVVSEQSPLLNGLDILQQFDWYNLGDPNAYSQSYVSLASLNSDERKFSDAWIDISEFHINVKNIVAVPEPSSLMLILLGGFILLIKRKQFYHH